MIGMGIRTLVSGDGIETNSVSITAWFAQDVLRRMEAEGGCIIFSFDTRFNQGGK